MVDVRVDSGAVVATDTIDYVPRDKWKDLMVARRLYLHVNLSSDCRCLVEFVEDAKVMHKELGFATAQDMIRDGYWLTPEEVSIATAWLRLNPPDKPIGYNKVLAIAAKASQAPPPTSHAERGRKGGMTAGWGRPKHPEQPIAKKNDGNRLSPGSNSSAYRFAHLKRSHPDVAKRFESGEFGANVTAAERAAGIKPPKIYDAEKAFDRVWAKATDEQKAAIRRKVCHLLA